MCCNKGMALDPSFFLLSLESTCRLIGLIGQLLVPTLMYGEVGGLRVWKQA